MISVSLQHQPLSLSAKLRLIAIIKKKRCVIIPNVMVELVLIHLNQTAHHVTLMEKQAIVKQGHAIRKELHALDLVAASLGHASLILVS